MTAYLYKGMGPPYVVRASVVKTDDFDPTTVVSTSLEITKPSGTPVEWPTAVVAQTADLLTVQHALATPDLDELGVWKVWAKCTLAVGSRRTEVGAFTVLAADQQRP